MGNLYGKTEITPKMKTPFKPSSIKTEPQATYRLDGDSCLEVDGNAFVPGPRLTGHGTLHINSFNPLQVPG